jgi:peptide/nickel transport system ATP-binding protein
MSLLELAGVSRRYPMRRGLLGRTVALHAVDRVTLSLAPGRTLGIVGESGCGKSTAGRLALGLEGPDEGSVHFDGAPMPRLGSVAWRRLRARMQMVFQDPLGALDRRLPIAAQVAERRVIHEAGFFNAGSSRALHREKAMALLRSVGLRPDQADRYPHELSGGQRQRAVLARALATNPALLVCDEPISGLDVSIQAQVINLLTDLQEARGIALLFISHDLRVVRQISHEVAVMYLGRIVERGDPDAIFTDPAHPYARALVSAIPSVGPRRHERIVLTGDLPSPADRPTGCAFHPRCPVAVAQCRSLAPELKPQPDGRWVACHLAHGDVAPVSRPQAA